MPKPTVLVIEDNEFNLKMATDLLDVAGFSTLEAEDADTGISITRQYKPDLVLMDMHLPLLDGYEATQIIKSDPETQEIPVVAFTALAMEDEQRKAIQSGCSGVISKPIDVDHFADIVASYLNRNDISPSTAPANLPDKSLVQPSTPIPAVAKQPSAIVRSDEMEEFLYRISHDLQAPLRKIRQFADFLHQSAKDELSPENLGFLEGIDRSATQMYELLSDLLTLSRIGRQETALSEFSLATAVQEAEEKNRTTIEELHAEVEVGYMVTLEGNYQELVQLFHQLINNALKFHREDIAPRISLNSRILDAGFCEIVVQDNGIGFKGEYAEQVFQPLHRLHGPSQTAGTGVGLAIVKKVVDHHQGIISAESKPEQGTTFTIRLPLKQSKPALNIYYTK